MKNIYGSKSTFAIEYEKENNEECTFEMWVDGKPICCFTRNGEFQKYRWNLSSLVEWFEQNIEYIITEREFPLLIKADSSIDFYVKSSEFDTDDMEAFDRWFDIRQEWYFHHSWFINRDGSFLPDVFFRVVGEKVEIEWDNTYTYEDIIFKFPKGLFYVDKQDFCNTLYRFLNSYKEQIEA